ncbi:MAG TPA: transglutaminase domain-containing protein, partial [bacterium]|nr:transglutaminase domain-containing protein [bacterium]
RSTPTGPYASELENFLFADDDRHGYCMHFASAAALMLRLRGVPCRIGVGLYGGDPDSIIDGARVFGSQHAHAWVEVPYEGRGFVVFDPTPARARGRAFVPDSRPLQEAEPDARDHTGPLTPIASALRDLLAAPWPWALALAIAFAIAVFPRRPPGAPQRATYPVEPGARRALRRLLRALARAGHQRTPNQTLELFARELDRRNRLPDEVAAAFRCYQEVRFGGRPFDDDRSQVMERAVQSAARLRSAREPSN